jgi:hydrogenase/urease accessory protein HupE
MKSFSRLFFILLAGIYAASAWAHKASDAYVLLKQSAQQAPIQIQFAVALRDLDRVFDTLDANNDRAVSFGEVKAAVPAIENWAASGVKLRCGGAQLSLPYRYEALEQRSDGVFVRLTATSSQPCNTQEAISLRYTLMQGIDADHRAVMSFQLKQAGGESAMQGSKALQPSEDWRPIVAGANINAEDRSASKLATLGSFVVLGMEHIGSGADHIAFVICLVLSLALMHRREWKALLIAVTAFTLGHSITLISATLGWVGSPSWVEPVIALSIAIAAAINLFKYSKPWLQSVWLSASLTAIFGLVHGLGFSGAMTEAQIPEGTLLWALAGFNIGVELGQLLIIAAWSLVYWAIHRWAGYGLWVVQGGSMVMIVLGLYWFVERLGWLC